MRADSASPILGAPNVKIPPTLAAKPGHLQHQSCLSMGGRQKHLDSFKDPTSGTQRDSA